MGYPGKGRIFYTKGNTFQHKREEITALEVEGSKYYGRENIKKEKKNNIVRKSAPYENFLLFPIQNP